MNINNDLSDFICVVDGVNYYNCIYAYQHKESMLAYIGQAKDYNRRDSQHLKSSKVVDGNDSTSFDAAYYNPDDWYRVIIHQDLPTGVLDVIEAQLIQEYGTYQATRGYNKTKGNLITVKKSLVASKQLDLSGNPVLEKKSWDIKKPLYSLLGTKGTDDKIRPHADAIPVFDDCITDFYEPFAGAANISRYLANEGRFHDNLTLHLNDGNYLNYNALRAVMEDPEELIDCIKNLLPVLDNGDTYKANYEKYTPKYIADMNGVTADGVRIDLNNPRFSLYKDGRVIDRELIKSAEDDIFNISASADHSVYDLDVIASTFLNCGSRKHMYYMFNGDKSFNLQRGLFSKAHLYNGSTILEYSEFLNYYNTVLSCNDYKDLVFGDAASSIIYCDVTYPDTAQSSTMVDMDEYTNWLYNLHCNGYHFTASCNNKCLQNIFDKFKSLNPDATVAFEPLVTARGTAGTMEDGVLWNFLR